MPKTKPTVYLFLNIEGRWVVTVSGVGGAAPHFNNREAAAAHAEKTARKYGAKIVILPNSTR